MPMFHARGLLLSPTLFYPQSRKRLRGCAPTFSAHVRRANMGHPSREIGLVVITVKRNRSSVRVSVPLQRTLYSVGTFYLFAIVTGPTGYEKLSPRETLPFRSTWVDDPLMVLPSITRVRNPQVVSFP
jgi:hypothetical protein